MNTDQTITVGTANLPIDDTSRLVDLMENSRPPNLWGHEINFTEHKISCSQCGRSESVPDLIRSCPSNEMVYKFYLLGSFKEESCESNSVGPISSDDFSDIPDSRPNSGRIYWSDSSNNTSSSSETFL